MGKFITTIMFFSVLFGVSSCTEKNKDNIIAVIGWRKLYTPSKDKKAGLLKGSVMVSEGVAICELDLNIVKYKMVEEYDHKDKVGFVDVNDINIFKLNKRICIQPDMSGDNMLYVNYNSINDSLVANTVSNINMFNTRNFKEKTLVNNNKKNTMPCWSIDGNNFAYASNVSGTFNIYKTDTLLSYPVCLTKDIVLDEKCEYLDPQYSPNNQEVLFVANTIETKQKAYLSRVISLNLYGNNVTVWTKSKNCFYINPIFLNDSTIMVTKKTIESKAESYQLVLINKNIGKEEIFSIGQEKNLEEHEYYGGSYNDNNGLLILNDNPDAPVALFHDSISNENWHLEIAPNWKSEGDTTYLFGFINDIDELRRFWVFE